MSGRLPSAYGAPRIELAYHSDLSGLNKSGLNWGLWLLATYAGGIYLRLKDAPCPLEQRLEGCVTSDCGPTATPPSPLGHHRRNRWRCIKGQSSRSGQRIVPLLTPPRSPDFESERPVSTDG